MQHKRRNGIESMRHIPGESTVFPRSAGIKSPYLVEVEEECEECGGSGYDCGSLSPIELEGCPACFGSGKQMILHNYLAEALRIAAGNSVMVAKREHLQAVVQHCRGLVGALMAIGDIR